MESKERVLATLAHQKPDRIPLHVWLFREDVNEQLEKEFGSPDKFYDEFGIDVYHSFPAVGIMVAAQPERVATKTDNTYGNVLTLEEAIDAPFIDPDDPGIYGTVINDVEKHGIRKGRCVYCQTFGVFETANLILGLQESLLALMTDPEGMKALFERIARWTASYVDNLVEIGVDVIHVSDDFGQNNQLLFNPKIWWDLIYPTESIITERVKAHGRPLSLHSDGYVEPVLGGILDLGFDCLHPIQDSAGMDFVGTLEKYGKQVTLMGGLDIRDTLPCGDRAKIEKNIRKVIRKAKEVGGGLIFCTSHMVQPDTPIADLLFAYEVAREEARF